MDCLSIIVSAFSYYCMFIALSMLTSMLFSNDKKEKNTNEMKIVVDIIKKNKIMNKKLNKIKKPLFELQEQIDEINEKIDELIYFYSNFEVESDSESESESDNEDNSESSQSEISKNSDESNLDINENIYVRKHKRNN